MQQRAGDVVRDVRDDLDRLAGEHLARMERERIGLDQLEAGRPRTARDAGTPPAAGRARPPGPMRRPQAAGGSGRRGPGRSRRRGRPASSSAASTIASSAAGSVRKFWDRLLRGRSRSAPIRRRSWPGVGGTSRSGASGSLTPPPATAAPGSASPRAPRRRGRRPRTGSPAAAPIIAPLSVHHAGGGTSSGSPSAASRSSSVGAQRAVGGHAAAERHGRDAVVARRGHGLRGQRVDDRLLERGGDARRPGSARRAAR